MLALIIPTLEEAANLPLLLTRARQALDGAGIPFEILVVDDDSRDGTAELVGAISQADPRVRLLVRKAERGLAGAILHGWQHTDAEILGVMDADLQHPPELLPALVGAVLGGSDVAIASRYVRSGCVGGWNPLRRWVSAIAVAMTWPLQRSGIRVKDPMSGFFVLRRACLQNIAFRSSGFKLLLELLVRARIASVCEIPMEFGKRRAGTSKVSLKVVCEYLVLVTSLYADRRRRPTAVPEPVRE